LAKVLGRSILGRMQHRWGTQSQVIANKEVDVPNHSSMSNMLNTKEIQDQKANQGMGTPSP
jgi:hypothetical protein